MPDVSTGPDSAKATRGEPRRFLVRALWSIRRRICRQVFLAVVERLAGLAGIVLLGIAVDRLIAGRTVEVAVIAAVIGVLAVVEAITAAAHAKQAVLACCEVYVPVRRKLVAAAHHRGDAFNDRFGPADLLTRASIDSEYVDIFVAGLGNLVGAAAVSTGGVVVGFTLDVWAGIVVIVVATSMALAVVLLGPPLHTTTIERSRVTGVLTTLFTATLDGLRTVGGLGLATTLLERQRILAGGCHRAGLNLARVHARIDSTVRLVAGLGLAGLTTAVALGLVQGRLTPGEAITGLGLLGIVMVSATEVSQALAELLGALAGASRLTEVLVAPPEPARTRAEDGRAPGPRPLSGPRPPPAAALRTVRFSYPGQPGREVLRGVDLTIEPGQLVALAGRSGSGKTTVLRMLLRSFDPTHGSVLLAGRDLRDIDPGELPRLVVIADQRPFLYDTDLAECVSLGRPLATRAEVADVLRRCAAPDLADTLAGGAGRTVGRRGMHLSGGQRRRVVLARALLPTAGLVLLDDPTASLDIHTEQRVAAELAGLRGGTTMIVATNRASILTRADVVVLLAAGAVLATGRHSELLSSHPEYRDLAGGMGFDDL